MSGEPLSPPDVRELFAQAGVPYTVQRRAVHEVLGKRTDHPTADTVFEEVVRHVPGISRTTVYRSLETLVQLGLASRLGHPGSTVRYDPKTERHHHLICESCGEVLDLASDALDALDLPEVEATGFRVRDLSVMFVGTCEGCSQAQANPPLTEST